jgi:uncharacterized protein (TIGR03086 family)
MSDNSRMYVKALDDFDRVVRMVPASAWSNQSPCEAWTARDVVGHVIAVQGYLQALARGVPPTLDPYGSPGALAGDDPLATWQSARESVLAAIDAPGVLDRIVQTFRAEETLDSQLGWNVVDTLAHTWDVARATGLDDHLDDELVAHAIAQATPMIDSMRHPPFFASEAVVTDDPSPAVQFLAMFGRRAD